ncbi:nucleoside diphosphate kinase [Phlyctochytrium arcticum]|nr:nucleoside diphosphate kinase [Phlyctochytrium arcticum]
MAATVQEENPRYCFLVHWYDNHAQLTRSYQLFYHPADQSVEMYDTKQRRTFLKRTRCTFHLRDLYVGAVLIVNARQLVIKDYGDEYTRTQMQQRMERALLMIKPHALQHLGDILDVLQKESFVISRMRMIHLNRRQLEQITQGDYGNEPGYVDMLGSLERDRCVAVEVMKPKAMGELHRLADGILRTKYGLDEKKNAVYVARTSEGVREALDFLFNENAPKLARTARFRDSTLAIIRPHAIQDGHAGQIIQDIIKEGYEITDLELFRLDTANAQEFLEVYKGVLSEYHQMMEHFTSGPVIACEVVGKPNIVKNFRELCGPMDPELARNLRPDSLRAKYGVDFVHNAVHCTDLDEDGPLEIQYFFRILGS